MTVRELDSTEGICWRPSDQLVRGVSVQPRDHGQFLVAVGLPDAAWGRFLELCERGPDGCMGSARRCYEWLTDIVLMLGL